MTILTKHLVPTEVPEQGKYGIPPGKKHQHCPWCVETLEVAKQCLYQLKGDLLLTQLGHGMLCGQAVRGCVTGAVELLLQCDMT